MHDYDMYLTVERGIRGGICVISHRHAIANNKYMPNYDSKKESSYITYLDANNLYGWAMSQYLPTNNYKWENSEEFNVDKIMSMTDEQATGYIFDCDLEYPIDVHDDHSDYPLAPEPMSVKGNMISEHSNKILNLINAKQQETEKLIPNLYNKTNYVVHYRNLKFYLSNGMKLTKINKVISFNQGPWMKDYIDFNTKKRAECKFDYQKDFFKLMNNAVFGKTMENVRKRVRFELVNNPKRHQKVLNDPTFTNSVIINENLIGMSRKHATVKLDKAIMTGFSVLDLSKVLMYDFHYNTIKKKYGNDSKLLFTDTDSLCYQIKTNDIFEDMKQDMKQYDTSDYPKEHMLYDTSNKKVIGKFKDEANSKIITEFIGLRAKMYAFKEGAKETKKGKGIKKNVVKNELKFADYHKSLYGSTKEEIQQKVTFNSLRSYKQTIYSVKNNKIGLCSYDDKRFLVDNVNTLPHGHYKILQLKK